MNSIAEAAAARNAFDPIEIKWPSMLYWFRAGAAASLGVASVFAIAWLMTAIGMLSMLATLGSLMHR